MSQPTDEVPDLLERVREGDDAALAQLLQVYESEIHLAARVLLGPMLRPHLDTMDLLQSVNRTLVAGLRGNRFHFSTPEKLFGLALTLLRRKVARHWRRLQRQRRLTGQNTTDPQELLLTLTSDNNDPACLAESQDVVKHFLASLEETDRKLVELRLEGYNTAEVARCLNLDADVLRVRLSRLRQRLRISGTLTEWL